MIEDPKLSRRYRELPREEPPRQVDEAILSASRRPIARRRWYFPVAAAAVIVLAVAVTVHVEQQQRDADVAEGHITAPRKDQPMADLYRSPVPAAPPPEQRAEAQVQARRSAEAERGGLREERTMAATDAVAAAAARSPEQWLQGIADLRRQGRHDEADRQLAEFRKRHPDYRIPEAMLERLEKR